MYSLSIKDLQALSGLSANIIRIWESRHGLLRPVSARQKMRNYTDEDVKRLLHLSILYQHGWRTTELATLAENEIAEQVNTYADGRQKKLSSVQALLLAAIDLNEAAFAGAFDEAVATVGFEETISTLVHSYLSCLRILSAQHTISAKEHFSLYIIKSRLITAAGRVLAPSNTSPRIALFSPAGPSIELPLLYLNYRLRKAGYKVLYIGRHKKLNEVVQSTKNTEIHALWIHAGGEAVGLPADDYLSLVRQAFSDLTIIVSGAGLQGSQRGFLNMHLLVDDAAIEAFIKTYHFGTT